MLAKCKNQVLSRDAACLGASEEECQDFIDDADLAIFEVLLDEQHCKEVASICKFGVFLDFLLTLLYDILAEASKCQSVTELVSLKRRDMPACKEWEDYDMRTDDSVDQVREGLTKAVCKGLFCASTSDPKVN